MVTSNRTRFLFSRTEPLHPEPYCQQTFHQLGNWTCTFVSEHRVKSPSHFNLTFWLLPSEVDISRVHIKKKEPVFQHSWDYCLINTPGIYDWTNYKLSNSEKENTLWKCRMFSAFVAWNCNCLLHQVPSEHTQQQAIFQTEESSVAAETTTVWTRANIIASNKHNPFVIHLCWSRSLRLLY